MNKGLKVLLGVILGLGIVASGVGLTYVLNDRVHDYVDNLIDDQGIDLSSVKLVDKLGLTDEEKKADITQEAAGEEPFYRINFELQGLPEGDNREIHLVTWITQGTEADAKFYKGEAWSYESVTHQSGQEIKLVHKSFENVGDGEWYRLTTHWSEHPSVWVSYTVNFKYQAPAASSDPADTSADPVDTSTDPVDTGSDSAAEA